MFDLQMEYRILLYCERHHSVSMLMNLHLQRIRSAQNCSFSCLFHAMRISRKYLPTLRTIWTLYKLNFLTPLRYTHTLDMFLCEIPFSYRCLLTPPMDSNMSQYRWYRVFAHHYLPLLILDSSDKRYRCDAGQFT